MGNNIECLRREQAPRVLYVTVLYQQRLEETNAYKTFLHDRQSVFIQDNSSSDSLDIEKSFLKEGWVYKKDPSNPGLSAAYNSAAQYALENGYDWIVITDQDTVYAPGAAQRYEALPLRFIEEKIFIPKVKLKDGRYLSPVDKWYFFSKPSKKECEGLVSLKGTAIINSGLMIHVDEFIGCGGYNESVFLDFSDIQFIERLSWILPYGRVIEEEIEQSFSAQVDHGARRENRFTLFCRSLKGYECKDLVTTIMIFLVVLKRAFSLCASCKSIWPLKKVWKNYIIYKPGKEVK